MVITQAQKKATKKWISNNYSKWFLNIIKNRANKAGVPFNLTEEDLIFPEYCPILGIKLVSYKGKGGGPRNDSPSIDRLVPELGYVKDNIKIISQRANRLKNNASIEELEKILDYMKNNIKN